MGQKTIINWSASVTTLAALIFLVVYFHESPPAPDLKPHEGLGQVLAGEALKLLGPGGKLSVVTRDTDTYRMPAVDAQMAGFRDALASAGKTVATRRAVKVDALRIVSAPPGEFVELARRGSEQDVIVSFVGPPDLAPEQLGRLRETRPKIVAACPGSTPRREALQGIFAQELLRTAIVSRNAATPPVAGETPRAAFDRVFKIVTRATLNELPAQPALP